MKRIMMIAFMLPMFSLSACASLYGKDSNPERNKFAPTPLKSDLDQAYINRVERQAKQRGVQVLWVSPPRAPKPKKDG
jgi:hypothetical protein